MNWAYIQDKFDWLGHIIEMLVIALVVAFPFIFLLGNINMAIIVGIVGGVMHFHGREKRDYETHVKMAPPHLQGYFMWRWTKDGLTDFLAPYFVGLAIMLAVYFFPISPDNWVDVNVAKLVSLIK